MLKRAAANVFGGGQAASQRVDQLVEEQRDSVIDLRCCRRWNRPHCHLRPAAGKNFLLVYRDEVLQHRYRLHWRIVCKPWPTETQAALPLYRRFPAGCSQPSVSTNPSRPIGASATLPPRSAALARRSWWEDASGGRPYVSGLPRSLGALRRLTGRCRLAARARARDRAPSTCAASQRVERRDRGPGASLQRIAIWKRENCLILNTRRMATHLTIAALLWRCCHSLQQLHQSKSVRMRTERLFEWRATHTSSVSRARSVGRTARSRWRTTAPRKSSTARTVPIHGPSVSMATGGKSLSPEAGAATSLGSRGSASAVLAAIVGERGRDVLHGHYRKDSVGLKRPVRESLGWRTAG